MRTGAGATNVHATGLVLDRTGLVILGPSGSGKSRLADNLLGRFAAQGRFARLVGDDRLLMAIRHGRLVARVPNPIAGLIERRGLGPAPIEHEPAAVIDRAVRLVPAQDAPRIAGEATVEDLAGAALPCLWLAERDAPGAAAAIAAWIAALPR